MSKYFHDGFFLIILDVVDFFYETKVFEENAQINPLKKGNNNMEKLPF